MRPIPILILSLLCCALVGMLPSVSFGDLGEAGARVDAYVRPLVEDRFLSGCLKLTRPGEDPVEACYGFADAAGTEANGPGTHFCIASITKPITVVALLRLVEEDKLGLDDPVSRWIEDFPAGDTITVLHLLGHTAGVPHRVTDPEEESNPFSPADIVERVRQQGLLFPPGEGRQYSSAGYTVLAYIMEQATEMSYGDLMQAFVFEPLGMANTFHPDGRPIDPRAVPTAADGVDRVEAPFKDYRFLAGAGSLYSTADDIARFGRAYLERKLLSDVGWVRFHELGWAPNDRVLWTGSTNGFSAWLDIDRTDGTVAVFLGNAGTGGAFLLHGALEALVSGADVPPPPEAPDAVALQPGQMHGLDGGYTRAGSRSTLRIELRDGDLYMGSDRVYPIAVDRFFNPTYFSVNTFERDEDGQGSRIEITAPGLDDPLVFERVSP